MKHASTSRSFKPATAKRPSCRGSAEAKRMQSRSSRTLSRVSSFRSLSFHACCRPLRGLTIFKLRLVLWFREQARSTIGYMRSPASQATSTSLYGPPASQATSTGLYGPPASQATSTGLYSAPASHTKSPSRKGGTFAMSHSLPRADAEKARLL